MMQCLSDVRFVRNNNGKYPLSEIQMIYVTKRAALDTDSSSLVGDPLLSSDILRTPSKASPEQNVFKREAAVN